jgi:uncharacterized protein YqgV (UPF0045/DUF77 family)
MGPPAKEDVDMIDSSRQTQDTMGLQFSVYPLRQSDIDAPIRAAIKAAADAGAEVRVGRLSTFASGDEESVFRAVRAAFAAAKSFGPTVMVVTLTSGVPTEETVSEIQATI